MVDVMTVLYEPRSNLLSNKHQALFGLFFEPEAEDNMFLRNVYGVLTEWTLFHRR
jgi:hypothetical protein